MKWGFGQFDHARYVSLALRQQPNGQHPQPLIATARSTRSGDAALPARALRLRLSGHAI